MHPGSPEAPQWIQWAIGAAMSAGVFVATLFSYIKKGRQSSAGSEVAVVNATFADRRTIEHLAEAMERHELALERHERAVHDLCEESRRTRQSLDSNTDALINLLRFMRGRLDQP